MSEITAHTISCPCCVEAIAVLVDDSIPRQNYVEDCQARYRPTVLDVSVDPEGDAVVGARAGNEL